MQIRGPQSPISHRWQGKLGSGESEVLQLGLEIPGDQLDMLGFRLASSSREAALRLAGEVTT